MNDLQIFENSEFGSVRTITVDGEPYFVGIDVADKLEYQNGSRDINAHVDECDRKIISLFDGKQNRKTTIINESGFYSLVFQSKMKKAKQFKHWVTSEVLPSIRKNGGYIAGQENMTDDELMAKALMVAQNKIAERDNKIKSLETEITEMDNTISEMQPKVRYVDMILQSKSTVNVSQIAQDYGMSATIFNRKLHELGIQYKTGGQWILYSNYKNKGYVHSETIEIKHSDGSKGTKMQTKWLQKGRLFLYEKLKKHGIYPLIESEVTAWQKTDTA